MPVAAQIIYQPYFSGARRALKASIPIICHAAYEGLRRTERALAGGSSIGAWVVWVLHDAEADEFETPEYLGEMGRAPGAVEGGT